MIKASVIVAAGVLGLVTAAGAADPAADKDKAAAKPPVSCDQIVESYKHNKSVDETSAMYLVDQARVAQCLKAAGVADPDEDDQ